MERTCRLRVRHGTSRRDGRHSAAESPEAESQAPAAEPDPSTFSHDGHPSPQETRLKRPLAAVTAGVAVGRRCGASCGPWLWASSCNDPSLNETTSHKQSSQGGPMAVKRKTRRSVAAAKKSSGSRKRAGDIIGLSGSQPPKSRRPLKKAARARRPRGIEIALVPPRRTRLPPARVRG